MALEFVSKDFTQAVSSAVGHSHSSLLFVKEENRLCHLESGLYPNTGQFILGHTLIFVSSPKGTTCLSTFTCCWKGLHILSSVMRCLATAGTWVQL